MHVSKYVNSLFMYEHEQSPRCISQYRTIHIYSPTTIRTCFDKSRLSVASRMPTPIESNAGATPGPIAWRMCNEMNKCEQIATKLEA